MPLKTASMPAITWLMATSPSRVLRTFCEPLACRSSMSNISPIGSFGSSMFTCSIPRLASSVSHLSPAKHLPDLAGDLGGCCLGVLAFDGLSEEHEVSDRLDLELCA